MQLGFKDIAKNDFESLFSILNLHHEASRECDACSSKQSMQSTSVSTDVLKEVPTLMKSMLRHERNEIFQAPTLWRYQLSSQLGMKYPHLRTATFVTYVWTLNEQF